MPICWLLAPASKTVKPDRALQIEIGINAIKYRTATSGLENIAETYLWIGEPGKTNGIIEVKQQCRPIRPIPTA